MNAHFSSSRSDWATPRWVYNRIVELSPEPSVLDVCATAETTKCARFYDHDALTRPWDDNFWMNPPYGRGMGRWMERAAQEAVRHGVVGTCLIPARTDTHWWHEYVMDCAAYVYLVRGRIKFEVPGAEPNSAPFPSAAVIYDPWHEGPVKIGPLCLHGEIGELTSRAL